MRPKWEFITGASNNTADALSRATPKSASIKSNESTCNRSLDDHEPTINSITTSLQHRLYEALRKHQAADIELKLLVTKQHSLQLSADLELINNLFCTINGKHIRIYVPHPLQDTMLHDIHDATHPGLRTTLWEATRLYYWPNMRRDVKNWTQACQRCQAAKVSKHNTSAPVILPPACAKFHDIHLDVVGPLQELKGMRYILPSIVSVTGPWQNPCQTSSPVLSPTPS